MITRFKFGDHGAFHRQVLRLCLVGAMLGFIGHIGGALIPSEGRWTEVLWMALSIAALGLAAHPFVSSIRGGSGTRAALLRRVTFGVVAGLVASLCAWILSLPPSYPWLGVAAWGTALGAIAGRDLRDYRRYALPLATALSVALATWVQQTFVARLDLVHYLPDLAVSTLYGAGHAFIAAAGLIVRQIHLDNDRVSQRFQQVKTTLHGEMHDLVSRAMETYRRTVDALHSREEAGTATDPQLVAAVEQLALRILDLAGRWQSVQKGANRTDADELVARLSELEAKIANADDRVAEAQYGLARDAMAAPTQAPPRNFTQPRARSGPCPQLHRHFGPTSFRCAQQPGG